MILNASPQHSEVEARLSGSYCVFLASLPSSGYLELNSISFDQSSEGMREY